MVLVIPDNHLQPACQLSAYEAFCPELIWSYVIGYGANLGWKGPLPLLKQSNILPLPHEDPFRKLVESSEQLLPEPLPLRSIRIPGKLIAIALSRNTI